MSTVAPPPEKTKTDRKTTAIECTFDDNNDMDDMVHYNDDPLEYLIDDRSEMWNTDDPFHILLLDTTFKQEKSDFYKESYVLTRICVFCYNSSTIKLRIFLS